MLITNGLDVLRSDAKGEHRHAQRLADDLGQIVPGAHARDPLDDLPEHEAPRHRVVGQHVARGRHGSEIAQDLHDPVAIVEVIQLDHAARDRRDPGGVREDVTDGDAALAVSPEARNVAGDVVVHRQSTLRVEVVDQHDRHDLGRAVEQEGGVWRRPVDPVVLGRSRVVAAGVPDGPVQHDLAPATDAERQGGMEPGAVVAGHGSPDLLHGVWCQAHGLGRNLPVMDGGDVLGAIRTDAGAGEQPGRNESRDHGVARKPRTVSLKARARSRFGTWAALGKTSRRHRSPSSSERRRARSTGKIESY